MLKPPPGDGRVPHEEVYAHAMEARDRELAGLLGAAVLGPAQQGGAGGG